MRIRRDWIQCSANPMRYAAKVLSIMNGKEMACYCGYKGIPSDQVVYFDRDEIKTIDFSTNRPE